VLGVVAAACGETSHVFAGRLFLDPPGCMGASSSIDVVSGDPPKLPCAATCLVQPLGDGGSAIYVSTMCAPYPFGFDTTGSDPRCRSALDAVSRNDACLSDGGSTHPAPADAGPDGGP
jgi:hypothetical protein